VCLREAAGDVAGAQIVRLQLAAERTGQGGGTKS